MIHPELWEKIGRIECNATAGSSPLSQQLMDSNGWTEEFALHSIGEYKRFIYLLAISHQALVPSDSVDQVWRLHMLHSRHYWGVLCKTVGRQLHYTNAKEFAEKERLELYAQTRKMYRDEFNQELDTDIWPRLDKFAKNRPNFVRVDTNNYLVLQKPTAALARSTLRFTGIAAFPLSVMGYAINQTSSPIGGLLTPGGWFLVAAVAVVIAVFGCLVWRMELNTSTQAPKKPALQQN